MVTIWGSDVFFNDRECWLNVSEHATMTASAFGLDVVKVKSNFRSFLNEGLLSTIVTSSGDGWWRGFQHGIGIIGHAAPITWIYDSPSVYIASSRSSKDIIQGLTCASHPSIDGKVRFAGTQVIHDSFEMSRQDKIECIVSFTKKTHKNIQLHVCWESSGGKNCNTCEKCLRTILGIISAGANPDDFGLHYNAQNMILIKNKLHKKTKNLYYFILIGNYIEIWNSFNANNIILQYPELQWFKDFEFEKIANTITKRKTLLIHPWKRLFRM